MTDQLTPEQRHRAMANVKLENGPLESEVCSGLRKRGLRFRKHAKSLPGSPDIVFPKQMVVVFVDGDFWHGWRFPAWKHKLTGFWKDKIETNRRRDGRNFRRLRKLGWRVVRIWQHQIEKDFQGCIDRVVAELDSSKNQ